MTFIQRQTQELATISTMMGAAVIALGNLLPYLTSGTLAALGLPGPWVSRIATAAGLLLIVYREKPKENATPAVPPFVQPPPENPT